MSIRPEWELIYDRIQSVTNVLNGPFELLWKFNHYRDTGLVDEFNDCIARWSRFVTDHQQQLPSDAVMAFTEASVRLDNWEDTIGDNSQNSIHKFISALRYLQVSISRFNSLLSERDTLRIRLIERGFSHLQRRIIADPNYKDSWQRAFDTHETDCEKLGGAHFLLHGVWCFKCDDHGTGGKTDLVMAEHYNGFPLQEVQTTSDALVLTEWKRLRSGLTFRQAVEQARTQAHRYSNPSGVLGSIELRSIRYLVIVSENWQQTVEDFVHEGNLYRVKNVVVDPPAPSRERANT